MEPILQKAVIVGMQLQNDTNFAYSMEEPAQSGSRLRD